MAVYENSRYLHTSISKQRGINILDIRDRVSFNKESCKTYTWCDGDTLDGVAYKYYNNSSLRWAILEVNTQYRTEFDIKNGDVILIPDYEDVVGEVNV